GIEDDPVADDASRSLENSGRDLVQDKLTGPRIYGMARIRPALVANDQVGALGEHIHDLALALVAPLGADDDNAVSLRSEHSSPRKRPARVAGREYGSSG